MVSTVALAVVWSILDKEGFMFVAGLIGLSKNIKLSGAKWYGKVATAVIYVGMILCCFSQNYQRCG